MDVWGALQYVETGLSLVAFIVAAILLAYRARLKQRAELIKSAPETERLEAIAMTAEFFRVDVSRLTREQRQNIALTQIYARTRRDLLLAGVSLVVAVLLAIVAIVLSKSGPIVGLDQTGVGQAVTEADRPLNERLENLAAQVGREKGIEVPPLRAILMKLGEAGVPDDQIPKRLDEKADELIKLREEIARLRKGPAELAWYAEQADGLIKKGDFGGARDALSEGRMKARTLRVQSSRVEADFLAREAAVDHIQLAYRPAASKYSEAANLIAAFDQQKQWEFVLAEAGELTSQGSEFGDTSAFTEATAIYRNALVLAQQPRDWALTQNGLGMALAALGVNEKDNTHLAEAVDRYHQALEEYSKEPALIDWADTQVNLGLALRAIGERNRKIGPLEKSVAAFQEALKVYTKETTKWAAANLHLGTTLRGLGEGIIGRDTAKLTELIEAYDLALTVYSKTLTPFDWAAAVALRATALRARGELETGTFDIEKAVSAYRQALTVYTPDLAPLSWAATKLNLGFALRSLGVRKKDTALLKDSVHAYRAALTRYTEQNARFSWASVNTNLADTLQDLAASEGETTGIDEAINAYEQALRVYTPDSDVYQFHWAMTFGNQGVARMHRAAQRNDLPMLETGLRQIEQALNTLRAGGLSPAEYFEERLIEGNKIRETMTAP